jgi:hypothetical protein
MSLLPDQLQNTWTLISRIVMVCDSIWFVNDEHVIGFVEHRYLKAMDDGYQSHHSDGNTTSEQAQHGGKYDKWGQLM